jgi:hydroxymethylbilane synthase
MSRRIVLGSRGSKLALTQAELVAAKIREANPELEISVRRIGTEGDRNHTMPLENMAGIGVFIKELEDALFDGRIDLAVHSLKDMPAQLPSGLRLAAVMERLDPRDVLISRGQKLSELAPGARVGTGSLRRAVQLNIFRPGLEICSIRGNVDTRLRKVADGEFDGALLAAAGIKRLGQEDRINEYLSPEYFLPAVGQGALAVEIRSDDKETTEIITLLNHLTTWRNITAERSFLIALGGGCRAPIAALATTNGTTLKLEGMVADAVKKKMVRSAEEGNSAKPEDLGEKLAQKLLAMGAAEFIAEAR